MTMCVQLLKDQKVDLDGKAKQYRKGDWIEVGKQTALYWISQKIAIKRNFDVVKEYVDSTSGIVVYSENELNKTTTDVLTNLKKDLKDIEFKVSTEKQMLYSENMIWNTAAKFKRELVPISFRLLKNWQLAIPLHSYNELACHIGNEDEREYTKSIIHDLRVPVYNTNLIFVRRCDDTKQLFDLWNEEKQKYPNDILAFHRAYYQVKPVLCALPVSWAN